MMWSYTCSKFWESYTPPANQIRVNGVQSRGGGGSKDSKGSGGDDIKQDGIVDLQHGTGVDGNSQPCIKGQYPTA